ncbi:SDR family oxidoreductase [Mesobacterium pallidum]|uniref:SDR family oxidoreductase n=1 Tax=Mesobacterium pallidum TaxID=2872037 RepID=UPI001EE21E6F|nr:SDR family oxidoreductase [Mesobacterium pallidum]
MKAVVLGAYGLIGAACLRELEADGFDVVAVGRDAAAARRVMPDADWRIHDLASLEAAGWSALVAGADVVVNASGALQDAGRDDLSAIHDSAVQRLVAALDGSRTRLVQISAAGVTEDAPTAFFRTKARGDAAIMDSALDWVILRPTLVIGRAAYGGTALVRAAAALPVALRFLPGVPVQCVALEDVAQAVVLAARGRVPGGTLADLTEPGSQDMPAVVARFRAWLGLPPARLALPVPGWMLTCVGVCADALGRLGWRSPLRSNAVAAMRAGITGDPGPWAAAGGPPCRSLDDTLAALPSNVQERWFARSYVLFPLAIAVLSLFWLVSGLVGLWHWRAATEVLATRGVSPALAPVPVIGGALADIALGLAILWRSWLRPAALGMVALSLGYLGAGTMVTPDIWADPLGPFLKVLPGVVLALWVAALAEDR